MSKVIQVDKTFKWFTTADLSKYEDKYVSIVEEQVVCADEDPEVAYAKAKERYPDSEIVLWKVPRSEAFIFSRESDDRVRLQTGTAEDGRDNI